MCIDIHAFLSRIRSSLWTRDAAWRFKDATTLFLQHVACSEDPLWHGGLRMVECEVHLALVFSPEAEVQDISNGLGLCMKCLRSSADAKDITRFVDLWTCRHLESGSSRGDVGLSQNSGRPLLIEKKDVWFFSTRSRGPSQHLLRHPDCHNHGNTESISELAIAATLNYLSDFLPKRSKVRGVALDTRGTASSYETLGSGNGQGYLWITQRRGWECLSYIWLYMSMNMYIMQWFPTNIYVYRM